MSRGIGAQTLLPAGNSPSSRAIAATPPASDSNPGDALLRRALNAVDAQRSIAAKVRQKVDLLGRPMFGSGIYLQQGRGRERMLRLELKLQIAKQTSSVQEICDGTALWICEDFGDAKSLTRVDMARLLRARPKSPPPPAPPAVNAWFALGGLPKLLASLESSFRFGQVIESRLDDLRVWTVEGQWKPARLAELLPDQKSAIDSNSAVDLTKLAAHLPDRVTLHIGWDDLFPYRIEYWRGEPATKDTKANDHGKLLVLMELYEVQLGGPIDPRQFAYAPGDLQPTDRTQAFLDKLSLEEPASGEANQKLPPRR
jgi:hypothetical protein